MTRGGVLVAALALAGCVDRVELAGGALPGLVAIDIAPSDTTIAIVLPSSIQSVEYAATGHFMDGTTRDITAAVQWTVDNPNPGAFAHATYATSNTAGGHVVVRAANGTVSAFAALTVTVAETIVDDGFPPPAGASDLFAPGTPAIVDPMKSPSIMYPADQTRFPQGLAAVLHQYKHDPMTDAYRLSFESDVLDLQVLTGADRWRPDPDVWNLIELSHPGTSLAFEVDAATSTTPGTIYTGAAITLEYSANDPGGALFYANKGLFRGELSGTSAAKLYPPPGDVTPVEAPALADDGHTLAIAYGGHLRTLDADSATPLAMTNVMTDWSAVSPDGSLVVVAHMGALALIDARTGQGIGSPDGHFTVPGGMATHPDWSPDGTAIVVAFGSGVSKDDLKGGQIARIPYLGANMWGTPQVLVSSSGDNDNNYFPRWSPDGNWIAYVHADGPAKGAPTAELRLVAAGGGTPIALAHASHQLGLDPYAINLANTMLVWAPQGPTTWLAFTSARPYGVVRPMLGGSQIWIAAIDLTLTEIGDPSSSSLWLPAQDITQPNVTPAWAPSVTTPE